MNKYLTQSYEKLKSEYKTYPAAEGVFVADILKSIAGRTPENILKKTDLFEFRENYESLSKKNNP